MTLNPQESAQEAAPQTDKELNFAKLREQLNQERQARLQSEQRIQELEKSRQMAPPDDEDDDGEPYVDRRKLRKELGRVVQQTKQETQSEIKQAVAQALNEERKQNWMKNNPDFYEVMQHAQKLADKDPELADTILELPDGFERQKLVYKNIKALNLHKKEEPKPSIQETIDRNRRSPYYQPSGVGTSPYASQSDFSQSGQKSAYEKMQQLKNQLRLG